MRMYERYEMQELIAEARQAARDAEDALIEYEDLLDRKGGATTREEAARHADLELAVEEAEERLEELEAEYDAGDF